MSKLYVFAAIGAGIAFAFYVGRGIGDAQCRARVSADTVRDTTKIVQIKREIDEKVFNTGAADIRVRLREKYTIAD